LQYNNQDHVYLVAGLNLPLLIELVSQLDAEVETTVLIQQVLTDSKKMIQFCNERINQEIEEDEF
ncbi:PTS mannose transporter subunit IIA, partial [Enterococcus faecium]